MTRVRRANRFVLDLSPAQRERIDQLARGRRDAYNFALALDRDTYAADLPPADWADVEPDWAEPTWNESRRLAPFDLNKVWPRAWPALHPSHPAPGLPSQIAFVDMDLARTAAAKRKRGFPRFRSRHDPHQTVSFSQNIAVAGDRIKVPSITEPLRVAGSTRRLRWFLANAEGTIQRATLVRDGVHAPWRCVVIIEIDIPDATAPDDRPVVGLDLGIAHFLTLSDGTVIDNPRILESVLRRLRIAQKSVSRSEQARQACENELRAEGTLAGNRRLRKGKRHVAKEAVVTRLHARVVALRTEFHHEVANHLVSRYRAIGIEDLNIAGMKRNHRLAHRISDVGWASFLAILAYKADAAGVEITKAGRWFPSSQRCSACGTVNRAVKGLGVRRWACTSCGVIHDRDVNAAVNLCPDEARIQIARAARLAKREKAAKTRASQKAKVAKAVETKKAKKAAKEAIVEAVRIANHEARVARHADRSSENLAVTLTDSNARRGPVRPKLTTTVVGAVARTETPLTRTEARTRQGRRDVLVGTISPGASCSPPVPSRCEQGV